MNSNRPYILRAIYEWILDNNCTPYILVNADYDDAVVPVDFVREGKIILDISPDATGKLLMNNSCVQFEARFAKRIFNIYVPIPAILAIYAKENGSGTVFDDEEMEKDNDISNSVTISENMENENNQFKSNPENSYDDFPDGGPKGGSLGGKKHLKVVK